MEVRFPAHAGQLYPANHDFLAKVVDEYLGAVDRDNTPETPKAVIAPHGGFIHSGRIAAKAFAPWKDRCPLARRIVLIGPSHHYDFPGIALPDSSRFETPLGQSEVDCEAREILRKHRFVRVFEAAHYPEHALEVLLPFVQRIFPAASIVPLILGHAEVSHISTVVHDLWGGEETIFVISSDLSHNHSYEIAQKIDHQTARSIRNFEFARLTADQACGYQAVRAFLKSAVHREMRCLVADLKNSADATGEMTAVTGFGAFHFFE